MPRPFSAAKSVAAKPAASVRSVGDGKGASSDSGVARRSLLRYGAWLAGGAAVAWAFVRTRERTPPSNAGEMPDLVLGTSSDVQGRTMAKIGPLGPPDENGLRLPAGFRSRVVARSGQIVAGSEYRWHGAPDGGATFPLSDGGWIYVSNAELAVGAGGAGAIRFDKDGGIVDAYAILTGTQLNCAGGPTPWGTWLSCEEIPDGHVYECDPRGLKEASVRPALGAFRHEAVAVDEKGSALYLTEDAPDGRLYRFRPHGVLEDLSSGVLEVCEVKADGRVVWHPLPDPSGRTGATRHQVSASTAFAGGEGIWFHGGSVFFVTKGNDRVWELDVRNDRLSVIYDPRDSAAPILRGVDNLIVAPTGDVLVAEDGGDMQIVLIPSNGEPRPVLQVTGQAMSEVTGPAFDPSLKRLYFSSQRGPSGTNDGGLTYEVEGPFFS